MKNLLAFLGAAAIAAVLMGTNFAGINPGASEGSIDATLGDGWVQGYRTTNNATPMFAVRIDDGRDDLISLAPGVATGTGDQGYRGLYWPFLQKGIPVTLALNYDQLGQAGFATVADIQRIIAEFDSAGVPISIAQHGNSDFGSGKEDWTQAQLDAEFSTGALDFFFGIPVDVFAQPGQGDALRFSRRNFDAIKAALKKTGIKYWDSQYGQADSTRAVVWSANGALDGITTPSSSTPNFKGIRPGKTEDPYQMPSGYTIDLGNIYVERDASETSVNTSDWTILADGSGTPTTNGNWNSTLAFVMQSLIGDGYGAVFALHDSVGSDTPYAGSFSPHHVAWVLDELRDAGFIRLGTVKEVYDWGSSKWTPGTNLTPNFDLGPPFHVIGDTSGVELGWLPGSGSRNSLSVTWTSQQVVDYGNGTNAKFGRDGSHPDDVAVPSAVTGYRGVAGGVTMTGNRVFLSYVALPPGRYEVSIATNSSSLDFRGIEIAMAAKFYRPRTALLLGFPAYSDTLMMMYDWDGSVTSTVTNSSKWSIMRFPLTVDPSVAEHRLSWTQDGVQSNSHNQVYFSWAGGIYLEFGPGSVAQWSDFSVIYLGPLD